MGFPIDKASTNQRQPFSNAESFQPISWIFTHLHSHSTLEDHTTSTIQRLRVTLPSGLRSLYTFGIYLPVRYSRWYVLLLVWFIIGVCGLTNRATGCRSSFLQASRPPHHPSTFAATRPIKLTILFSAPSSEETGKCWEPSLAEHSLSRCA